MSPLLHRPGILEQALQPFFDDAVLDLGWTLEATDSGRNLLLAGPGDSLLLLDEDFPGSALSGDWTKAYEVNGTATETVSGGSFVAARATGNVWAQYINTAQEIPAVNGAVQARIGTTVRNSTYNNAQVGIYFSSGNRVHAEMDHTGNVITLRQRVASGSTTILASTSFTPNGDYTVHFGYFGSRIEVRIDSGSGFVHVLSASTTSLTFFSDPTGWYPMIGISVASATNSVEFNWVKMGAYGYNGRRDIKLVTNRNGSPYDDGTYLHFTMSCSTVRAADSTARSYTGIFRLDKSTYDIEQTGRVLFELSGNLRELVGCHLVKDGSTWRFLTSGFGGPGGVADGIRMFTTETSPLSGLVELDTFTALSLPLGDDGAAAYDPALYHDGSVWRMAYAITDETDFSPESFYPAIATSNDLSSWTLVMADAAQTACEGVAWQKIGANVALWAPTRSGVRIYDRFGTFKDTIADFGSVSFPVSPPWVAPFPTDDGGDTEWRALRFNGTYADSGIAFSWGNVERWVASPVQSGAQAY